MEFRRFKCMSTQCAYNDTKFNNNCEQLKNTSDCQFPFIRGEEEPVADVRCNDGLCAIDLKAWLGASRVDYGTEDDPFVLYQQGKMTKGALLNGIVDEVNAFIKKST